MPDEPCITDDQCEAGQTNYICRKKSTVDDYVCTCNGFLHQVDDETLCLQQGRLSLWLTIFFSIKKLREMCEFHKNVVAYGDFCTYNDECQMADPNMECDSSKCSCDADYSYDTYIKYCVYCE